jgi:4-hydroxybenzoate polyprenyltransferase
LYPFLKLARPHQYVKNGFVLIGPIFGGAWSLDLLAHALLLFVAFSLMASSVYVFNDIVDVEADRAHPTKRLRPIASGKISAAVATRFASALAIAAIALAAIVSPISVGIILVYALMQIGYSTQWKHVVVIDVFLISFGFMLRILIGTVGLDIPPSSWLLLCGLMVTLFLGFAKRHSELNQVMKNASDGLSTRKVLDDYSPALVEQYMSISAACTILAYSLYTVAPETIARHGGVDLIFTVPFVIYGIFRYLYLLHSQQYGTDASREIFTDRHLLASAAGWFGAVIVILAAHS